MTPRFRAVCAALVAATGGCDSGAIIDDVDPDAAPTEPADETEVSPVDPMDKTPPQTILTAAGAPAASLPWARFEFVASELARFECRVDGSTWAACSSPAAYPDLGYGAHDFAVRAVDRSGNVDPTPAAHVWTAEPFVYATLSETGLYTDITSGQLAPDVVGFSPAYHLWSDGVLKRRWIRLPPGAVIDTRDMNGWQLPVGTQLWKEFVTQAGMPLETRLIERRSEGGSEGWEDAVWFGSFIWRADGSDADFAPAGQKNVAGTSHDVPPATDCWKCHIGQPGFILGFSAVQLSRSSLAGDITLEDLGDSGLLSDPPPDGVDYPVPGQGSARASLGFLHANCGHCHNPNGWLSPINMDLWLRVEDDTVDQTQTYRTTVGVRLQRVFAWDPPDGMTLRISPGDAAASAIWYRASRRDAATTPPGVRPDQMPSMYTEVVPQSAVDALASWIGSM